MQWLLFIFGIMALCLSLVPVLLARNFVSWVRKALLRNPDLGYRPKTVLIVPCKGIDPNFEINIQAVLDQDLPNLDIFFVTATDSDPAHSILARLIANNMQQNAQLFVAGVVAGCSQKVNNQLKAVAEAATDTDVFVFMDSDARPKQCFVRHLIQPLADRQTGLSTGFRWYMPENGNFWSILRSAWNGGGIVFLRNPKSNYAWGGAMAIRKDVYDSCKIAEVWKQTLSDDMTITAAVRNAGLGIEFVPHCLVTTHEDCSFGQMFEWTSRQTIIAKVYHPALWWQITIAHCLNNVVLVSGLLLFFFQMTNDHVDALVVLSSLLMMSIVPMEVLNARILLPSILDMLPEHRSKLQKLLPKYLIAAPLASVLALMNTLFSMSTNRITWRGVTYEMRSPTETIVISENP